MRHAVRTFVVLGFIVAAFIAPSPARATFPELNGLIAFQADVDPGARSTR